MSWDGSEEEERGAFPHFYNVATVYIATLLSANATQIVKYNYSLTNVYDGD